MKSRRKQLISCGQVDSSVRNTPEFDLFFRIFHVKNDRVAHFSRLKLAHSGERTFQVMKFHMTHTHAKRRLQLAWPSRLVYWRIYRSPWATCRAIQNTLNLNIHKHILNKKRIERHATKLRSYTPPIPSSHLTHIVCAQRLGGECERKIRNNFQFFFFFRRLHRPCRFIITSFITFRRIGSSEMRWWFKTWRMRLKGESLVLFSTGVWSIEYGQALPFMCRTNTAAN